MACAGVHSELETRGFELLLQSPGIQRHQKAGSLSGAEEKLKTDPQLHAMQLPPAGRWQQVGCSQNLDRPEQRMARNPGVGGACFLLCCVLSPDLFYFVFHQTSKQKNLPPAFTNHVVSRSTTLTHYPLDPATDLLS